MGAESRGVEGEEGTHKAHSHRAASSTELLSKLQVARFSCVFSFFCEYLYLIDAAAKVKKVPL